MTMSRAGVQWSEALTTAVEQSVESIIITDVEGRIEYVNPAFERVSGYRAEEVQLLRHVVSENIEIRNISKPRTAY